MVSASVIEQLNKADQEITLLINSLSWPCTDWFWMVMSDTVIWIPAYLICAFFLFKRLGWQKALIVIASAAICFGICDQLSNLVKHSVLRLRPNYTGRMLREGLMMLEKRGGFYGFFSAHAANSFAFVMCLIIGFRNDSTHTYNAFWKWALVWAALVSISRIFVGKHYFGDILAGSIIGVTVGYFVRMLARYLIQRFVDKVPPTGLTMIWDKPSKVREGLSPS